MTPSKTILITGCSSGIGQATAKHLNERGWTVYATARRQDSLAELHEAGCHTLALDVTDEASMRRAVGEVEDREGAIGVLVNNAGYSQSGAIETVPMDAVRAQFETNVFGMVRMCQLVLPGMRAEGGGKIVNLSSMGGRFTFPGGGYYHASKHAVEAISDALRFEVQEFGIRVIIVEPGLIRTQFGASAVGSITSATAPAPDGAGPYDEFNAAVGSATVQSYEVGPIARLGGPPEAVARKIEKAISTDRPRTRYTVTPSAKVLLGLHALLPDRGWDAFVGSQFPRPGKARKGSPST
jgi:NAD(P)-dependent dehydrogenase (short-subunit alcohol dehydrogenase family)